jgi:murein L,D-transpeptidase YcbB/YkuD
LPYIEYVNGKVETAEPPKTTKPSTTSSSFLPSRGYFQKGDTHANVGKIASFMRKVFPSYTSEKALGNYYGDNLIKAVKEFQERSGLEPDGYFGKLTLAELKKHGFKE